MSLIKDITIIYKFGKEIITKINNKINNSWGMKRHMKKFFYISLTISISTSIVSSLLTWYDLSHGAKELIPVTIILINQYGQYFWILKLVYIFTWYFGIRVNYWLFRWTTGMKESLRNLSNNLFMVFFPIVLTLDAVNDLLVYFLLTGGIK